MFFFCARHPESKTYYGIIRLLFWLLRNYRRFFFQLWRVNVFVFISLPTIILWVHKTVRRISFVFFRQRVPTMCTFFAPRTRICRMHLDVPSTAMMTNYRCITGVQIRFEFFRARIYRVIINVIFVV